MKAIINAELVMRDHFIPDAVLFIDEGRIFGYGEMRNTEIPDGCEIIDAEGEYVGPGLIDIHSHTGDDINAWEDPTSAASFHLSHGVTTYLPTSYGIMSKEEYITMCHRVREAMNTPEGKNIGGIYFEGPYSNPKYGSNRNLNPWNKPVLVEDYEPIIEASRGIARVWGLAPEREDILPFVKAAKKAEPNVRFAVTHSEATPQQIERLIPYGLCIGTHHTNATGTIVNYPECRGCCVDEAVNYNKSIYAEIISDSRGIHVDPYMQRLVRQIKGDDRIILISDRTKTGAPNPEGYEGVTDLNFDSEAEIAGSKLSLEVACRNFMKHTGASMVDAFKFASLNPATALGFTDRGQILEGLRADLVIVDRRMNVKKVFLEGELVRG